ncbi:MAG: peptidylprolyl isomerase, partial [Pseudomonadota bacterium]|nr:peptidylprolyl isomerase [Pseudomonadota bacterium]
TQYKALNKINHNPHGDDGTQPRARAETLQARVAGGADFADIAREHSEDPSSQAQGGDLGWFTQNQFGPDFGREVVQLTEGQVSAPIRTQAGWHIVERTGTRQAEVGDDNVKNQLRETIGRRKLEDQWSRFLSELRGEAFVDVRAGADEVDTQPAAPATGG